MLSRPPKPEQSTARNYSEDGYVLLTVLVMVFLVLLTLSIAAPRVAKQIQRDKEEETIQRGLQYKRAIRLYYRKFGAYPSDIKQLENANQIRFLRKRYKDPMTGQDDWRLIHMGEAKVPLMGFFGQPLQAGLSVGSTSAMGATPGLYAINSSGSSEDATGGTGTSSGTASSNNTNAGSTSSGSSSFGFNNNSSGSTGLGNNTSTSGTTGQSGFGFSNNTNSNGTSNSINSGTGTNGTSSGFGSSGSSFGSSLPIVGVGLPLKKNSLIAYRKQTKYSAWEFVYDPQEEMLYNGGGIATGGNVTGTGANGSIGSNGTGSNGTNGSGTTSGIGSNNNSNGSSFGFGNSNGGSGSSFGFGNSGSGSSANQNPQ